MHKGLGKQRLVAVFTAGLTGLACGVDGAVCTRVCVADGFAAGIVGDLVQAAACTGPADASLKNATASTS